MKFSKARQSSYARENSRFMMLDVSVCIPPTLAQLNSSFVCVNETTPVIEKLHSDWAQQGYQLVPQPEERHQGQMQHQNVRQPVQRVQQPQIQAQQRVAAQQPRPDLEHARISDFGSLPVLPSAPEPRIPIPFVDVPPTYDEVMGARSSIRTQVESSIRRLAVTNTRPRPASCPDLTVISPTGGYYPDGYDDAGPSEIHRQEPPRRPFMDGPPALPEFVISPTDDADHHPPGLPFSPYHPLRQVRSVGGFGNAGSWAS